VDERHGGAVLGDVKFKEPRARQALAYSPIGSGAVASVAPPLPVGTIG